MYQITRALELKKMCHSVSADLANPNVASCLDDLASIPDLMQPIATQYKREIFLANSGYFIRPIQLTSWKTH
jgi:hypothetical protein